jgi:hypothetical protein
MLVRFVQSGTPQYVEVEQGNRVAWEALSEHRKSGCMVLSSSPRVEVWEGAVSTEEVAMLLLQKRQAVNRIDSQIIDAYISETHSPQQQQHSPQEVTKSKRQIYFH